MVEEAKDGGDFKGKLGAFGTLEEGLGGFGKSSAGMTPSM